MQEVEQRREQLPRGNQNKEESLFNPLIPTFSLWEKRVRTLKPTALYPLDRDEKKTSLFRMLPVRPSRFSKPGRSVYRLMRGYTENYTKRNKSNE
jgi:hypothetical protein